MRTTYKCLECGGTLRLCSRFESEGIECWHCDTCDAKVTQDKSAELSILGACVPTLERALDKLRATQVRHGTVGLENDLRLILSQMDKTRQGIIEVLKRMDVPLLQEVKPKLSYADQLLQAALKKKQQQELRLEGE